MTTQSTTSSTNSIANTLLGNSSSPSSTSSTSSTSDSSSSGALASQMKLTANDFINLMVTELQNQDPTKPASNEDLLAQMSQIGQLQTSTDLQTSLKSMTLQTSLGSAGNLIGKSVEGLDDSSADVTGLVNSVRVEDGNVYLELDSGKTLQLGNVTSISPGPTGTTSGTTGSTTGSTTTTPTTQPSTTSTTTTPIAS